MKTFLSSLNIYYNKHFFLGFLLLLVTSSCSTEKVDDEEEAPDPDLVVQFSEKSVFNNELSGRIMAPDFQLSLFSNTSGNRHFLKSIFHKSKNSKLVIHRGEGENINRSLVFPIAGNEVSPFGYEFVVNEGEVRELNIIEKSPSQGTYTILYNLYLSSNLASNAQSRTKNPAANTKNFQKSSAIEEKTLEEEYKETTEILASPFINLFGISLAEINRKLDELPARVQSKLGEWKDEVVELAEKTEKAVRDMAEVKDELETAEKEPLGETLTEEEKKVKEETKSVQIRVLYPDNGMTVNGEFYKFTQAYYDGNHLFLYTHRGIYCESEGNRTLPLHDLNILFTSYSTNLPEGIFDNEELRNIVLNIYTGGGNENCRFLTLSAVSGTVEIINEDILEINFDFQTYKDDHIFGSYKGSVTYWYE